MNINSSNTYIDLNSIDFGKILKEEENLYFDKILPLYIDIYYSGKGYYFIRKMLDDLDNNKFMKILENSRPASKKSLQKSQHIRKKCPVKNCREVQFGQDECLVLGTFSHIENYVSQGFSSGTPFLEIPAPEYKTTKDIKSITIFEGSFKSLMFRSENDLRFQILKTIFHEYVHYFESFFFKSEQLLTERENNECKFIKEYTLDEAKKKDRDYTIFKTVSYAALFISASVVFWILMMLKK